MVQGYKADAEGALIADEVVRLPSPDAARAYAQRLADRRDGVIAYEWRGEPSTGEDGKLKPLLYAGALPDVVRLLFGLDHA